MISKSLAMCKLLLDAQSTMSIQKVVLRYSLLGASGKKWRHYEVMKLLLLWHVQDRVLRLKRCHLHLPHHYLHKVDKMPFRWLQWHKGHGWHKAVDMDPLPINFSDFSSPRGHRCRHLCRRLCRHLCSHQFPQLCQEFLVWKSIQGPWFYLWSQSLLFYLFAHIISTSVISSKYIWIVEAWGSIILQIYRASHFVARKCLPEALRRKVLLSTRHSVTCIAYKDEIAWRT